MPKTPLVGSERKPLAGATPVGKSDPSERLEVTLLLRRHDGDGLETRVSKMATGDASVEHIDAATFDADYGADAKDIAAVKTFAAAHGLSIAQEDAGRRTVILGGTVAQFEAAFDVELQQYDYAGGSYRGRTGAVHIPDELQGRVEAVMGLDNRPAARPYFRSRPPALQPDMIHSAAAPHAAAAQPRSFAPPQLAQLYDFPAGEGQGETIALIELGGGYRPADIKAYFHKLGLKAPKVTSVSVDHGRNHPTGDANGPDGEVMLDIDVAGAVAPGAHIVVYFAPNTDAGFLNAITTATHDQIHKPSVISISWGGPESSWTPQSLTAFDSAFQAAAAMGISVFAASGDNGAADVLGGTRDQVDFPASSPHVTGCGGTNLAASATAITGESVWNDGPQGGAGGGGVSAVFATPAWQMGLMATRRGQPGNILANRGVPDVAGDADPQSGYEVRVDGQDMVIGGTSAVAPLWAGLIARINGQRGARVGFVNPKLYQNLGALNDIRTGDNGDYEASAGWDACTGLGTPIGSRISGIL
jgi:kumamolisin